MAVIRLTAFSGEQPLIAPSLLPDTAAQDAINLRLNDGGLTPIRQAERVDTIGSANHKTFLRYDGEWLSFSNEVHAVQGPVAQDRLYYTGDGVPKVRIVGNTYPLSLSAPATALTAIVSGSGDGNVGTRLYVYTWVTEFGEESEPSPPSADIDWKPGQTVTLSGFANAPTGRGITKQRIYRSQTGQVGTYLYFIAERNVTKSNFVDNVSVDSSNEALPSADWNAPPDTLSGLTALPNGMLAAFSGRDLYFCEPWRPHAWPEKYILTTDYPIVALGAVGRVLIVLTEGQPFYVNGTHPSTMRMERIEQNLPCINSRAVVDLGYAIAYPTTEGLVVVGGDGSARIVTTNLFDRDKWLALSPSTAIGSQLGGRYVLFYDTVDSNGDVYAGTLFFDVSGTPYLLRSSECASAAWFNLTESRLLFIAKGSDTIFELDPTTGARAIYSWRSKEFLLPFPTNFGAILIDSESELSEEETRRVLAEAEAIKRDNEQLVSSGGIAGEINSHPVNTYPVGGDMLAPVPDAASVPEVTVYADGNVVATVNTINRPVRLPSGFLARCWEVAATGRSTITKISLAHSMSDLKAMG